MIEIAPSEYFIDTDDEDEAILYCFQLNINGKTGWRLPTRDEYFDSNDIEGWFTDRAKLYDLFIGFQL